MQALPTKIGVNANRTDKERQRAYHRRSEKVSLEKGGAASCSLEKVGAGSGSLSLGRGLG